MTDIVVDITMVLYYSTVGLYLLTLLVVILWAQKLSKALNFNSVVEEMMDQTGGY